jgi:hypothetical protein
LPRFCSSGLSATKPPAIAATNASAAISIVQLAVRIRRRQATTSISALPTGSAAARQVSGMPSAGVVMML